MFDFPGHHTRNPDMNDSILDEHELTIDCPECHQELTENLGRLKRDPVVSCPSCKASIVIDTSNLNQALASVDQSLADLKKNLGGTLHLTVKI
jgi:Zn finger protein HypA/HybF involved in hydrogenase expression